MTPVVAEVVGVDEVAYAIGQYCRQIPQAFITRPNRGRPFRIGNCEAHAGDIEGMQMRFLPPIAVWRTRSSLSSFKVSGTIAGARWQALGIRAGRAVGIRFSVRRSDSVSWRCSCSKATSPHGSDGGFPAVQQ